jgi:acyl-CoA thioester hydrolase
MSFRHSTRVEVRFVDIDAFGHVNNANYLSYIEQARVNYFDEIVNWPYDWSKEGIILAKAELDYIQPIKFKDEITIYTRCSRLGNKSLDLEYRIIKMQDGKEILMADANTVLVAFDYINKKPIEVPAEWRRALLAYEEEGSILQ